MVSEEEYF